jgi:hypothetical protein
MFDAISVGSSSSVSCDGGLCDEGAVLGTDQRQVAFSSVSAVLCCLKLPLEATHACHTLL